MNDKTRYPYSLAMTVAEALRTVLEPFCERIEIAGSLRRKKLEVGDIEILYIPKMGTRQRDLLETEQYDLADQQINAMLIDGRITKRPSKIGVFTWGPKNKLGIHTHTGIPVDFFATTESAWWNSLVCRTGGKDSNLLVTTTAQKRGYSFEAYGCGFRPLTLKGQRHDTTSERDVFEFIGLPYLPPEKRQ